MHAQAARPVRRAAFLDRDGVLLEILRDPELGVLFTAFSPSHVRLASGAAQAVERLAALGYERILVSNQPGPAKGHFPIGNIASVHARMEELLGSRLEAIYVCPHHPQGGPGGDPQLIGACDCRKPRPGMLLTAARERGLDLPASVMIGDSLDDVRAGKAAGVRTVLINGGRCELCPARDAAAPTPDATVASLAEAVDWIARQADAAHPNPTRGDRDA